MSSDMKQESESLANEVPGIVQDAQKIDGQITTDGHCVEGGRGPLAQAVGLLSQQVWCWGRDIVRPEGNWLLEVGFNRTEPPAHREECSSVYVLELPEKRCVLLRGFGVFYGDPQHGGIFLPRYEFLPRYTADATLEKPPWSSADLPDFELPNWSQRASCAALTLDLLDWIRSYEVDIVDRLGIEYRRSTLLEWDDWERPVVPADRMMSAWQELALRIADNFDAYARNQP